MSKEIKIISISIPTVPIDEVTPYKHVDLSNKKRWVAPEILWETLEDSNDS